MSGLTARIAMAAVTLLAFALRVLALLSQSLWRDEVDALLFATRPLPQLLDMFRQPGQNGPLFFLVLRPWLAVAGHSEFGLRFPAALAGTLSVPLIYALLARLAGRRVALLAALFVATAPYGIWYGQEAKMYALLTVLVPASLLAIVEIARRGGWAPWAALYLLTSLTFYTHLLAVLVVAVQALWLLILPWAPPRRRVPGIILYLLMLGLPYVPFLQWVPPMWTSAYQTGHPFVSLGTIFQILAGAFSRGVLGIQPVSLLPYMIALVAGIALWPAAAGGRAAGLQAVDREGPRHAEPRLAARRGASLLLGIWLLAPPLLIYVVSLGMPIFTDRYLIWILPAYCALLACGVVALNRIWRPIGVAVTLVIFALNGWSVYLQASQPIKADFRAAASYVLASHQPDDVVLYQIPYNRFTFSYYASRNADPEDPVWTGIEGPYTNNGMTEAEADAWMATRIGSAQTVWLIMSEAPMWDERNLTGRWLEANATSADHAEFARVTVTRFVR